MPEQNTRKRQSSSHVLMCANVCLPEDCRLVKSSLASNHIMTPSFTRQEIFRFVIRISFLLSVLMKLTSICRLAQILSRLLDLHRLCWHEYEQNLAILLAHVLPSVDGSSADISACPSVSNT